MIIGIDASRANEDQKTGVGWYAYFLIQELKKVANGDIQVILYSRQPLEGELAELPEGWSSKVLGWWPGRLWTQVRLSIEMLFRAPDVLFVPAHVPPAIYPKKTVMMVHDVAAVRFPESYNWFERWLSVRSARQAVRRLWKVLVPSEFTKEELLKIETRNGKQEKKITVVPHGYSDTYRKIEDRKAIDQVLKKYDISRPFALSIGRLEGKKNTERIIEAFEKVKTLKRYPSVDFELVFVGRPGHGYDEVQSAIDSAEHKDDIHELGYVEQDDMPYVINAAEMVMYPSLYEGFGFVALEAMACGTPVITSKGTSVEEVAGDAAVYVDPMSVDQIAEAMQTLLDDEVVRHKKIQSGFGRVKRFSWQRCAEETLCVFLS